MYEKIITSARTMGAEAGEARASWFFDGNTSTETYARVVAGLDEGDPEILDELPYPDLSGQWADEPAGPAVFAEIVRDALGAAWSDDPSDSEINEEYDDLFTDALDAYCEAFTTAAHHEVERVARLQTTTEED